MINSVDPDQTMHSEEDSHKMSSLINFSLKRKKKNDIACYIVLLGTIRVNFITFEQSFSQLWLVNPLGGNLKL